MGDGREWCRQHLYNDTGTAALRLCRLLSRARPIAMKPMAAILSLVALCGCSYQLASLVSTDESGPQATGTIKPSANASSSIPSKSSPQASVQASPQAELDLAYARAAATEALSRGSRDASLPWQNPHTAAPAAISRLWRRPTRKLAWPAGTFSPATCTATRRTGSKGLPAVPPAARGR